MLQVQS